MTAQALIYCALGIWCLLKPESTSLSVGFLGMSTQGVAEFVAVYGGLEFGLGVFFGLCSVLPNFVNVGVLFALCLYAGLVVFRTAALFMYGNDIGSGWYFYAFEMTMLVVAAGLSWKNHV